MQKHPGTNEGRGLTDTVGITDRASETTYYDERDMSMSTPLL
jgi:hypothetical protein